MPISLSSDTQGILLVNKPKGKTSFYLVKVLRKLTGVSKIGHAGTLDPFATGVMVMLIGKNYTRFSDKFLDQDKEYLGTICLGASTDTYDCEGVLNPISDKQPSLEEITLALASFNGAVQQVPPMFSAKKVAGKKLYELARQGISIERASKEVQIQTTIIDYHYPYLTLKISCSKGTYIRSLAHDLGIALATGGYLHSLTRLKSGFYGIEECVNFDTLIAPSFSIQQHLKNLP